MTLFDIESADLARFDRRMLADVGLVEGEEPHPSRLRKLPARASSLGTLVSALLSRMSVAGASGRVAR